MTSFQPLTEQLRVDISKRQLRIVPSPSSGLQMDTGDADARSLQADNPVEEREFEVEVVNQSSRFASFEIELSTPGQPTVAANHWYDVEPKVCAKKPPGDRTTFRIVINRPPIPAIDTTLDLTVHVFSVEYDDLETTHHLDLAIEPRSHPLQVHLMSPDLKAYPGERLAIEVLAMNLQSEPADITLKVLRLDRSWFTAPSHSSGTTSAMTLQQTLPGGDTRRLAFHCIPPQQPPTPSSVYEFDVEISGRSGSVSTAFGRIEVLPAGIVNFICESRRQTIPNRRGNFSGGWHKTVFPLTFENWSNLTQQIHLQAAEVNRYRCTVQPIAPFTLATGDHQDCTLEVRRHRPWLGWERRLLIDVTPTLTYPEVGTEIESIHLKPSTQALDVRVRPVIPLWLQISGGIVALLLMAWWLWLRPITRHQAPITTVQFVGKDSTVLTGARDQTVWRWDVRSALGWFRHAPMLRDRTQLATANQLGRAVRVIRQSPKGETQVAISLENGAIELWDIDKEAQVQPIANQTDRVFALAFTTDGQSLFSGHGSGRVRRWSLDGSGSSEDPEQGLYIRDTAIADVEVLDHNNRSLVAIGGQFNRLVLWDWLREVAYEVDYSWDLALPAAPVISSQNSLTAIEASLDGHLLATADNRGFITFWDGQDFMGCTQGGVAPESDSDSVLVPFPCPQRSVQLQQWQATENGAAVRAMALSEDGCYLATATDRGEIALWTIDSTSGRKARPDSIPIHTFRNYAPYEIDIKQRDPGHLLIVVDGPNHRARLFHHALDDPTTCSASTSP